MGDRLATIDLGRSGSAVPLSVIRELGHHLTECRLGRGLLPTGILIHATVWPRKYTNVTDRQTDRQDNGPVA